MVKPHCVLIQTSISDSFINNEFYPEFDKSYPLNLSILLSGGNKTNRDSPISGERKGKSPRHETVTNSVVCLESKLHIRIGAKSRWIANQRRWKSFVARIRRVIYTLVESRFLRVKRKSGGNLHLRLNIIQRPIANKYREGKLKSTSQGELKDLKSLREKRVLDA